MRLSCIRHGRTVENEKGVYAGASDGVLTDEERARLAGVRFDAAPFDAVYCSPAGRCVDTARALGIRRWTVEPRIAERDFGVFEGLSGAECEARYPDEYRAFLRFDAESRPPNGESRAEHLARVVAWLRAIRGHRHVLAITHGGTIDFLYRMARGLELHGGPRVFSASNASVSTFAVRGPDLELVEFDARLAS
ncbi:MAG: histidine phosphatase family protein [Trueperaceae bacterium]|nr:MAG: histidine phosphatase family protein [Trueperaceae bacterium]